MDHIRAFLGRPNRILRNIGLNIAQFQVVAGIEHPAVCVAASVQQIVAAFLRGSHEHLWPVKMFCEQSLGYLRSKIAKVYAQRVASGLLDVLKRLHHMDLAFYDADRAFIDIRLAIFCLVCVCQRLPSIDREALWEAVSADSNDSYFDFRYVHHHILLLYIFIFTFLAAHNMHLRHVSCNSAYPAVPEARGHSLD